LSIHNIHFLINHVRLMREALLRGTLEQYAEPFLNRYLRRV